MIAAIMCGGRASRMQQHQQQTKAEKPLLKVGGLAMVERVISALDRSKRFDRIVAAVSPNTVKTKAFLKSKGIETIETAGKGYSQDLSYLLSHLKAQKVIVVPADIPLLNSQIIKEILDTTADMQEPSISIVLNKTFVERLGAKPSIVFDQYCHSGITIFNTMAIGAEPIQEYYLAINRKEIALNVNTKEELNLAEKLLV